MKDPQIRAAFPVPEVPATLDTKIDLALATSTKTKVAPRRLVLGFALTAGVAVALIALPARQAQASLVSILGALESSTHVRIIQTSVKPDGRQVVRQTVDVDGSKQHVYDAAGRTDEYVIGTHRLAYDPVLKVFVDTPRPTLGGALLKVRFAPGKGVYAGMDSEVVRTKRNGTDILRATVKTKDGAARFLFDASPVTKRPLVGTIQIREPEGWRTVETTRFVYDAPFHIALPTSAKVHRITSAKANARYRDALSDQILAQAPLGKDRLVVRRLDVAKDGMVFVAFQRGPWKDAGFRGYTLRLTDDLGTEYVRVGQTAERSFDGAPSPDGPFAMEAFVPRIPVDSWRPRRLRLQAHRFDSGIWAGTFERTQRGSDGILRPWLGILQTSWNMLNPRPLDLPEMSVPEPTCGFAPPWAAIFDPARFGDERLTLTAATDARAEDALAYELWDEAARLFTEALELKREEERLGYGPMEIENDRKGLAKAQEALGRGKP